MCRIKKALNNESGFTLIEVLVVMSMLGVLLVHFLGLLDFSYQYLGEEKSKNDQRSDLKVVSVYLMEDVMFSDYVDIDDTVEGERVLSFKNKEGKIVDLRFVEEKGLYIRAADGWNFVVEGEAYEEGKPMVIYEDRIVEVNFFARHLNILLDTKIRVR